MHSIVTISREAEQYVRELYRHLLDREPHEEELKHWVTVIRKGMSDRNVFYRFVGCEEYRKKHRLTLGHPVGHYHSPIVDPAELTGSRRPNRDIAPQDIAGIELSLEHMEDWWRRNLKAIRSTPFPEAPSSEKFRYYSLNDIYPFGDAVLLRAMILERRPKRIIEVGSGFSSACMLDTIDEAKLDTELTLIEPDIRRLRSRLRPSDEARVNIIESLVQDVPLDEFKKLEAGDIFVVDSSHVMKTGSDVHRVLFEVLPILRARTLIHFHDVGWPFEYPDVWLFEKGYSWNEVYAIRAFLMHNQEYRVEFMSAMFSRMARELINQTYPAFAKQPSGSLWIGKIGGDQSRRRIGRREGGFRRRGVSEETEVPHRQRGGLDERMARCTAEGVARRDRQVRSLRAVAVPAHRWE